MSPTSSNVHTSGAVLRPPRLLTKAEAASYLGISENTFGSICDVRPVALADGRARLLRYDVNDLDAWIDSRKGLTTPSKESGNYWVERMVNGKREKKPH